MRVVDPGVATIQDGGRPHARRYGFPAAGPLDADAWTLANAVVGNPPGAAAIEILAGTFVADLRGRVALGTFDVDAVAEADGRPLPPWTAATVAGRVRVSVRATTYLAVAGGIDVPPVLGSRSSLGATLRPGDDLPAGPPAGRARRLPRPPVSRDGPLRVVPGPQADRFPAGALTRSPWTVGDHVDRRGARLAGDHALAGGGDVLSDGVVPGAIQVPPDGQPIIVLADGPTTGGYPKIGVVVSVDLPRAGRLRPGDEVRFELVTVDEAHALRSEVPGLVAASRPLPDAAELLAANLVSGAVDAGEGSAPCG